MATTPITSPASATLDINSSADSLREAAMTPAAPAETPAAAPVVVPAAPAPDLPYTVTSNADGSKTFKLVTGEELSGKSEADILPLLAKSKVDTTNYAKGLKSQLE